MRETDVPDEEVFRPSSGRVTGALAVPVAALIVVIAVVDGPGGFGPRVGTGAVLLGLLAWASMLRPRVVATGEHLVLRNMFETIRLPWAAIEEIAVRQVLAVRVGEHRYVSPVIGRPLRKVLGNKPAVDPTLPSPDGRPVVEIPYADYAESEIRRRAELGREVAGVRRGTPEQEALAKTVQREPAWLVIGSVVVVATAFVVSFFL